LGISSSWAVVGQRPACMPVRVRVRLGVGVGVGLGLG